LPISNGFTNSWIYWFELFQLGSIFHIFCK
jgi:hypothetical protein